MIYQINSENYVDGNGFFVGDMFITSGHVINRAINPWINVYGNRIYLDSSREVLVREDETEFGYDIAIYKVPEGHLEQSLLSVFPNKGDILESISIKTVPQGNEEIQCSVEVGDAVSGYYFSGITDKLLKEGSSGSPVFYNGGIIGVMTKGNNDGTDNPCISELPLNFCLFLSSKSILELVNEQKLSDK